MLKESILRHWFVHTSSHSNFLAVHCKMVSHYFWIILLSSAKLLILVRITRKIILLIKLHFFWMKKIRFAQKQIILDNFSVLLCFRGSKKTTYELWLNKGKMYLAVFQLKKEKKNDRNKTLYYRNNSYLKSKSNLYENKLG